MASEAFYYWRGICCECMKKYNYRLRNTHAHIDWLIVKEVFVERKPREVKCPGLEIERLEVWGISFTNYLAELNKSLNFLVTVYLWNKRAGINDF